MPFSRQRFDRRLTEATRGPLAKPFRVFHRNPATLKTPRTARDVLITINVVPRGELFANPEGTDDARPRGFGDDQIYVANCAAKFAYEPYLLPQALGAREFPWAEPFGPLPTADATLLAIPPAWEVDTGTGFLPKLAAPKFGVLMTYALARFTVSLWECYAQHGPMAWFAATKVADDARFARLQLVPLVSEEGNLPAFAISSFGYVELGYSNSGSCGCGEARLVEAAQEQDRRGDPYWINPDIVIHELAHQFLFSWIGFGDAPDNRDWTRAAGIQFRAFHESFADMVSIVTQLHLPGGIRRLLSENAGDIFTVSALSAFGDFGDGLAIRSAVNSEFFARRLLVEGRGVAARLDATYRLSLPLTGAFYDVFTDLALRHLMIEGVFEDDPSNLHRPGGKALFEMLKQGWDRVGEALRRRRGIAVDGSDSPAAETRDAHVAYPTDRAALEEMPASLQATMRAAYAGQIGREPRGRRRRRFERAVGSARDLTGDMLAYAARTLASSGDPMRLTFGDVRSTCELWAAAQDRAPPDDLPADCRGAVGAAPTIGRIVREVFEWRLISRDGEA